MTFLSVLSLFNFCLVLVFGLFLSVHIAGGWETKHQKNLIFLLCPCLLLIQGVFWLIWDEILVERLYPLIAHLPIVLVLVFVLKKKLSVSIVGVLTAYLCCQLPHWAELALADATGSPLIGAMGYCVFIIGVYILLRRFFVLYAHAAISYSRQTLLLFGSLPLIYYIFDYVTTVYTSILFTGSYALYEFFPTVLAVFYVFFLAAYHTQTQERTQAELHSSMLHAELRQSTTEIEALRRAAFQTAVYQHDMRHHLNMIDSFIGTGKTEQALAYIESIRKDISTASPAVFCENEALNLLCSSFSVRADRLGIDLRINVTAPAEPPISDTELCSLLSTALENALHAASDPENPEKWVDLYSGIKRGKLCIEIKNPYTGIVPMRDGIPLSAQEGHGYGCYSIRSIVESNGGICVFQSEKGIFTLRVILPLAT